MLLRLKNIKKSFGINEVLKDINLDIKKNSVIGLVGLNGAWKTTLANIISLEESIDNGQILKTNENMRIHYLRQSTTYKENNFNYLVENKQDELQAIFKKTSYLGLNKVNEWTNEQFNHLSGGEKTKLLLSEVFNTNPDLVILDEPTNHLDFRGIDWLIKEIKQYVGTILVISHDRFFLDQVVDIIAELEHGIIKCYNGNYTTYRDEKLKSIEIEKHHYEEQRKKERQIDEEINRLKKWSYQSHKNAPDKAKKMGVRKGGKEFLRSKAKKKDVQIKSKIKRLEKMKEEGIEKPKEEEQVLFDFVSDKKSGRCLVSAEQLSKHFEKEYLFKNSQFSINRGEKIGLIGVNGCGKTTLIKMILGEDHDYQGKLFVSKSAKIAYLSQDVLDLDEEKSIEEMIAVYDKVLQTKIRTYLASSGITNRMVRQKVKSLSLGERTRIKLIFLIIQKNNVLILDEPTNHLDLHSRETLEKTLSLYQGTVIIASHDRYLLEKITNKLLIFDNKKIQRIEEGFKEYQQKKEIKKDKDYELMLIQNRITYILSEMNKYKTDDDAYHTLKNEFFTLMNRKKKIEIKGEEKNEY